MSRARSRLPWLVTLCLVIGVALTILALRASWSRAVAPAHHASASSVESHRAAPSATFVITIAKTAAAPGRPPAGMVWIPGGEFSMGSHVESESLCALPGVTRDALPVHRVYVDGFWMDATEVTNDDFARFVKATGYVTIAERTPTAAEFPGAPPENLVAGSMVFTPTAGRVPGRPLSMVAVSTRCELAPPGGSGKHDSRSRKVSGRADCLRRRRGVCERGPASVCRPKRSGSSRRAAG